jgi:hypothetical protein
MGLFGFGKRVPPEVKARVLDYMEETTVILAEQDVAVARWDEVFSAFLHGVRSSSALVRHTDALLVAAERLSNDADRLHQKVSELMPPPEAYEAHRSFGVMLDLWQTWAHEQLASLRARKAGQTDFDEGRVSRAYEANLEQAARHDDDTKRMLKDVKISPSESEQMMAVASRADRGASRGD